MVHILRQAAMISSNDAPHGQIMTLKRRDSILGSSFFSDSAINFIQQIFQFFAIELSISQLHL